MPEEINDGRVYVKLSDRNYKCIGVDNLVNSEDAVRQVGNIDMLITAKENQTFKAL